MKKNKFRAWLVNAKRMVYGYEATNNACFTQSFKYRTSEVEMMQHVGIEDVNSQKIYDGDYVRIRYIYSKGTYKGVGERYEIHEVYFNEHYLQWQLKRPGYSLGFSLSPEDTNNYEIIGNKYENPEMEALVSEG